MKVQLNKHKEKELWLHCYNSFFINNIYSFIVRNGLLGIEQQWQQRLQVNRL